MNAEVIRGEAGVIYSPLLVHLEAQESIFSGSSRPVAPCALKHHSDYIVKGSERGQAITTIASPGEES
jgi:hypothetical protein